MAIDHDLPLHEQVMLLALHDRKGTTTGYWSYAVAGAILAELVVRERIRLEPRGKKPPLVDVASPTPVDDPVLEEGFRRIRTAKRRASAQTWVSRFAHSRDLKHRVAGRLARRGILRTAEDRVMLLFSRRVYPELDPEPERRLVERIREAVLGDHEDVDPDTGLLVTLSHSAGLLRSVLDRKTLKARKDRLDALRSGAAMAEATRAAIQAAQAAAVATSAAITAATTAATAGG